MQRPQSCLLEASTCDVKRQPTDAARMGEMPVLVTSPSVRPHIRSIVERFRPQTVVMSQGEVHPHVRLKTVGSV